MGKSKPKLQAKLIKHQQLQSLKKNTNPNNTIKETPNKKRLMNRNELVGTKALKPKTEGMSEKELELYKAEKLKHAKVPYERTDKILLIGEGNFSFANALCKRFKDGRNIWATCYDSFEDLIKKYGKEAEDNIENIKSLGGQIFYEIDATKLDKHKKVLFKSKPVEELDDYYEEFDPITKKMKTYVPNFWFDKIVFNFPHAGLGIKDQTRNTIENQQLLLSFFRSSVSLVHPFHGELHVTLKSGQPYDSWRVSNLAKQDGLWITTHCFPFNPKLYDGYEHRRTLGFKEGVSQKDNKELEDKFPKTYIFGLKVKDKKQRDEIQRLNPPKKRKQFKNR